MKDYKAEAKLTNSAKLKRMGIEGKTENGLYGSEKLPKMLPTGDAAVVKRKGFATGGGVLGDVEGDEASQRLDRARRGKTNVNIMLPSGVNPFPQEGEGYQRPSLSAMPSPDQLGPPGSSGAPPMVQMPGGPPSAPGGMGGLPTPMLGGGGGGGGSGGGATARSIPGIPSPAFKRGGRAGFKAGGAVKMDAGAGSGEGRLEKDRKYGKNAKPGR